MDVKCERCSTEYEFDDALVSGRGTTVKCTNCGYKFKIRRSDGDYSEDFWNVTAGDGRTLVFTSLRELQRAIQSYLVDRHDRLSRGGLPPKAIGEIPELAPFFEQRDTKKGTSGRPHKTQEGIGLRAGASEPVPSSRPRQATKPEFPAPPPDGTPGSSEYGSSKTTLIGTGPVTAQPAFEATPLQGSVGGGRPVSAPPTATERQVTAPVVAPVVKAPSAPPPLPPRRESIDTQPIQRTAVSAPPAHAASVPPPLPHQRTSDPGAVRPSEPAVRTASHRPSAPKVPSAPPPLPARAAFASRPPPRPRSLVSELDDESSSGDAFANGAPRRRRSTGAVVAAVLVAGAAIVGGAYAKKQFGAGEGAKTAAPVATVDPRVASFLSTGEKALAEGNLELAKESFDKASALAETNPHVLLDLAELAAVRADVAWLKVRLLAPEAIDEERATRDSLNELAASARNAADAAVTASPDDPGALRAKVDAARISGDRAGARAVVGKIAQSASQPETAYVLAALDLADPEPPWASVIDRLKTAATTESGPGRARAALVYALARSGDAAGAKAEVQRLGSMPKAHPLLPLLRAFVERGKAATPVAASASPAVSAAVAVDTHDATKPGGHRERPAGSSSGAAALPTDSRELLSQGERARAKGDYERARTLFNAAIDKNPNDSEALAGLGAIAYAQHDLNGARSAYKRVVAINPNYMPAVVGLADVEWDAGDRATATRMYKDIVDRYPEGAYPARVKQRSDGGG